MRMPKIWRVVLTAQSGVETVSDPMDRYDAIQYVLATNNYATLNPAILNDATRERVSFDVFRWSNMGQVDAEA